MWGILSWCALAVAAMSQEPIADEGLRGEILAAVFPGAKVSVQEEKVLNDSYWNGPKGAEILYPDVLKTEKVYRVVAPPRDHAEECAAESVITMKHSQTREVRFRVWGWPSRANDSVAVVQYRFLPAQSSAACESIVRAVHVTRREGSLHVTEALDFEMTGHIAVQRAELIELSGDGVPQLIVETDAGGGGVRESRLAVIDLASGKFEKWLNVLSRSRLWNEPDEEFTQVLDVERTRASHGTQFCFTRTLFAEKGTWLHPSRRSDRCYSKSGAVTQ